MKQSEAISKILKGITGEAKTVIPDSGGSVNNAPLQAVGSPTDQIFGDSKLPAGATGFLPVTIEGDQNLKPENVKAGVSIFGVAGTYSGDATEVVPLEVTPTKDGTTFNEQAYAYRPVTVLPITNLRPENVKSGVQIADVIGTYEAGSSTNQASRTDIGPDAVNKVKLTWMGDSVGKTALYVGATLNPYSNDYTRNALIYQNGAEMDDNVTYPLQIYGEDNTYHTVGSITHVGQHAYTIAFNKAVMDQIPSLPTQTLLTYLKDGHNYYMGASTQAFTLGELPWLWESVSSRKESLTAWTEYVLDTTTSAADLTTNMGGLMALKLHPDPMVYLYPILLSSANGN